MGEGIKNSLQQYGRVILATRSLLVDGDCILCGGVLREIEGCVEGNGQFELLDNRLVGLFKGELGSYQLRLKLGAAGEVSNGVSVRFKVQGWSKLRYVAIGYTSHEGFQHVKIVNLRQGEWLNFSYGFNDLVNKIQSRWNITSEAVVNDIRVYVSGRPGACGGILAVEAGETWLEDIAANLTAPGLNSALSQVIIDYFLVCHPETHEQAQRFLSDGSCPMTKALVLEWSSDMQYPEQLEQSTTFRYLWHACQPAMKLLVHAIEFEKLPALFAARDMINSWLDSSFYVCAPDQKYTWYDHGVAERLLCLLLMQQAGLQYQFDQRFMARLAKSIRAHTQLLESEAFYSCHQPTRYHNHAWFQDVGLMAAAVSYGETDEAAYWFMRGQQRLQDQIHQLVKRENGYAVFVENSSGYHEGIQRLIYFVAQLERLVEQDSVARELLNELEAWSAVFTYPDGRLPAHGDTFRVPNPENSAALSYCSRPVLNILTEKQRCEAVLLPESGYFIHKGISQKYAWFIGMVATNSSKTHKHQDDTSLVLWLDGIEWLIDPSFYSHDFSDEISAYCHSAAAHNMLSLPGRDYAIEPIPGRASLEYIDPEARNCQVKALNRSYKGIEIQRSLHCIVNDDVFHVEVFDSCTMLASSDAHNGHVSEMQVITFHFGDGVLVRQLPALVETEVSIYELGHPATPRRLQLHLPRMPKVPSYQIEQRNTVSGLQFKQSTVTPLLQLICPIGTDVKWKIYVN
ncbi:heparinase II/III family protein [Ectopseudomonas hydrolytica]|uniref:heparinase II/III family protein n=1 Tax=Ectopseudomonas hydrolytica TaxID=2493633 RepID=UPI003EE0C67B